MMHSSSYILPIVGRTQGILTLGRTYNVLTWSLTARIVGY